MQTILERIARNPDRGLAIAPGQTVEDLFREREELYRRYADVTVPTAGIGAVESARRVLEKLAAR
jgi:shikimate kinase